MSALSPTSSEALQQLLAVAKQRERDGIRLRLGRLGSLIPISHL